MTTMLDTENWMRMMKFIKFNFFSFPFPPQCMQCTDLYSLYIHLRCPHFDSTVHPVLLILSQLTRLCWISMPGGTQKGIKIATITVHVIGNNFSRLQLFKLHTASTVVSTKGFIQS